MDQKLIKIAPSLLAANFAELGEDLKAVDTAGADLIHMDIMDGHFVPNISFGPAIVKSVRSLTKKPFDVHLMIDPVEYMIPRFIEAGANSITLHIETGPNVLQNIKVIKQAGLKVGLSLKPDTSLETLDPYLELIDLILVMTVNPGFGGQAFMTTQLKKIETLREKIEQKRLPIEIEVDGGITPDTAKQVIKAGATILVAGTAIFKHNRSEYQKVIDQLRCA